MAPRSFLAAVHGWSLRPLPTARCIVKIDRKRKIAVTTLLRALGITEASMREAFKHVDTGKASYLDATLEKDPTKGQNEALIEVYRRLRPGDLALSTTPAH